MRRVILLLLASCGGVAAPPDATATLSGTVTLREGDCMPPANPSFCLVSTPSRAVYLFPVQYFDESSHVFPTTVGASPVAQTISDAQGHYSMPAPPGRWSVFVEDEGHLYSWSYESNDDAVDTVELVDGGATVFDITINHATE